MSSETLCTFLRCFHRRESMSHRCGVEITIVAFSSSFRSVAVSPVSIATLAPIAPSDLLHAA